MACTNCRLAAATRTAEEDKGRAEINHIQGIVPPMGDGEGGGG